MAQVLACTSLVIFTRGKAKTIAVTFRIVHLAAYLDLNPCLSKLVRYQPKSLFFLQRGSLVSRKKHKQYLEQMSERQVCNSNHPNKECTSSEKTYDNVCFLASQPVFPAEGFYDGPFGDNLNSLIARPALPFV